MLFMEIFHEIRQGPAPFFGNGVVNRIPAAADRAVSFDTDEVLFGRSRDELRFKMSKAYSANSGDAFSVSMNWTHPTEDCTANGTSQIGLTRVVELGRGKSARIEGDGGVVIDLKRLP